MGKFKDINKLEIATRFYAIGVSLADSAKRAGVSSDTLKRFINSEEGAAYLSQVKSEIDAEFANLYGKVVDVLRNALDHPEVNVALSAASLWLKSAKSSRFEISVKKNIEDLTDEELLQYVKNSGYAIEQA